LFHLERYDRNVKFISKTGDSKIDKCNFGFGFLSGCDKVEKRLSAFSGSNNFLLFPRFKLFAGGKLRVLSQGYLSGENKNRKGK
jgi:hypothetical protein